MHLEIITPSDNLPGEIELVNYFLTNGLTYLHLRKPGYTGNELKAYINEIKEEERSKVIVHGAFPFAKEMGLAGIHKSGYNDKSGNIVTGNLQFMSTSFHSWDELRKNSHTYYSVLISPVFDSISKSGYKKGIELSGARQIKNEFANEGKYCPLIIGLGGITDKNVLLLKENEFDGAAMLGFIWQSHSPKAAFENVMRVISVFA